MADQALPPPSAQAKAKAKADRAAAKAQAKADLAAAKAKAKADAKAEKERVRSLAEMAQAKLLEDLKSSLKTHARSATFACGGSVAFKASTSTETDKDGSAIDPVQIRFGESGKGITLVLPSKNEDEGLAALVKACQPASFGRGNEAVLDETYRKAGKLDREAFATSFSPYEAGIIDVVTQLLVPQTKKEKDLCGIKAELYKLNVYSAPSGKFKAHVDTPRNEAQIGSLVVSLPIEHEGGQLAVRSAGKELLFDWSTSANTDDEGPSIKWAAFYSDCEHEVFEVTSGHRLTLTYNLYLSRGSGHLTGSPSALDPVQLPLYETLEASLENPGFFRHGRILAIWLTHSYAHTNKTINFLPSSLKGADMSLYETANALGLWCELGPIITSPYSTYYEDMGGDAYLKASKFYGFNKGNTGSGNLDPEGGQGFGSEMPAGKLTWLNPMSKSKKEELEEAQMAYMTYGNEPGIDIWYSRAAMLIRIPPYRMRGREQAKNFWEGILDDYAEYEDMEDFYDDEDFDDVESDEEELDYESSPDEEDDGGETMEEDIKRSRLHGRYGQEGP